MNIAKINHNTDPDKRVTLSIDLKLNLYADGEKIESTKFKNLKEVEDYIGTKWASGEWDLEWIVEDLANLDKPVRFTLRVPGRLYEKIWQIHAKTHKSIKQIIVDILQEKLGE